MPKTLTTKQRAALQQLIEEVNHKFVRNLSEAEMWLEANIGNGSGWLLDWPVFSAGENMPGYMPESPYSLFLTERAARGYCRELTGGVGKERDGYVSDYMTVSIREVLS